MKKKQEPSNGSDKSPVADGRTGSGGAMPDGRERRSRDRVADDQKSGLGAKTALSRLQMIERRRAAQDPDAGRHE